MSLLSKYYNRKYMVKTLTDRMNNQEQLDNIVNEVNRVRSLLSVVNETYESAACGFFATAGEVLS